MFISQLVVNGTASQADIVRAFGVPAITVKRAVKTYRTDGLSGFFVSRPARRGNKLTSEKLTEGQALLDQGEAVPCAARACGVMANMIYKAIRAVRLCALAKKTWRSRL